MAGIRPDTLHAIALICMLARGACSNKIQPNGAYRLRTSTAEFSIALIFRSKGDSDSIASDLPTSKMTGAARRPVSIIEKNARVIKWIHGCRVAPTPGGEVRAKVIGFEFGASPADV